MKLPNRIQTDLLNLSQVPEPPKKIVPEKKVPAPAPKEKVPPAKGILGIILLLSNTSLPILMLNWHVRQLLITLARDCVCVFRGFWHHV